MRAPIRPRDLTALLVAGTLGLAASGTHVVRSGETLAEIAADHGTSIRALVEANRLRDADLILVGQELLVPGTTARGAPTVSVHVVKDGETLGEIAQKYGATVGDIVRANGIQNPNRIRTGQSLKVGAGATASTAGAPAGSGRQLAGQRHKVRSGETLVGIARRYGLSSADLARWNGITDGRLYATVSLVLYNPGTLPGSAAAGTGPATHTVRSGETLSDIASRYGSSVSGIVSASGLRSANFIRVGQRLTIPAGSGATGIRCPVPGASFINDWGFPRSGGRAHAGNDLFAPRGTPVRAPVSGVVHVATGTIGGHQFRLTAADGTMWFGSHMDRFGRSGRVAAGDVIGYVGDSGNARGGRPHLHFEVHPGGGAAVNPYPLLRSLC